MVNPQGRTWCGTLNHDDDEKALGEFIEEKMKKLAVRGVYQEEVAPSTGQLHLQYALVFDKPVRLTWLKANVCPRTHWTLAKGNWDAQVKYCTKEESRRPGGLNGQFGDAPAPGARTDLDAVYEMVKANKAMNGSDLRLLIADAYPAQYAKYHHGIDRLITLNRPCPDYSLPNFRPHQQKLADILDSPADDRKIIWVYDPVGNTGKTALMKHYLTKGGAVRLSGKKADMAHAYEGERIVFFDLSRTSAETAQYLYDFAEELKSGVIFSGKYDSQLKRFDVPHVVFLANTPYPEGVWSADRKHLLQWSQPPAPMFNAPKD